MLILLHARTLIEHGWSNVYAQTRGDGAGSACALLVGANLDYILHLVWFMGGHVGRRLAFVV